MSEKTKTSLTFEMVSEDVLTLDKRAVDYVNRILPEEDIIEIRGIGTPAVNDFEDITMWHGGMREAVYRDIKSYCRLYEVEYWEERLV